MRGHMRQEQQAHHARSQRRQAHHRACRTVLAQQSMQQLL